MQYVIGEEIRDFRYQSKFVSLVPQTKLGEPLEPGRRLHEHLWRGRTILRKRLYFGKRPEERGLRWYDYAIYFAERSAAPIKIAYANISTHNHFVIDRGRVVFNAHGHVLVAGSPDATLEIAGILNSSVACFWLKQVSHNKGGPGGGSSKDEKWRDFYEFTGTKLQEYPLPSSFPRERARLLDSLAQELSGAAPAASLAALLTGSDGELLQAVDAAQERWERLRCRMVFEQEELDWEVYRLYGVVEDDLTYHGGDIDELLVGERAFEIALARGVAKGTVKTRWFSDFCQAQTEVLPKRWPSGYARLVDGRLSLIAARPDIGLLETPDFKRTWSTTPWDAQLREALEAFILDRLEDPGWWRDAHDVSVRSVAQLADLVRHDEPAMRAITLLTGTRDADVPAVISKLMTGEAVPFLAAHRYSPSGLEKHAEWEKVWDLQRREDAGEKVQAPVPPKYNIKDFRSTAIWQARGKLDVPKERFISYPDVHLENDPTVVFGWAGWDHRDQAIALARLVQTASDEVRVALLAGLVELEPWLHQWHAEPDARTGASPAETITAMLDGEAYELGMTRADLRAWRPPAPPGDAVGRVETKKGV